MFIGYFTERPYQDASGEYISTLDLAKSNRDYDPKIGAELYNRYLDEKVYAEQMGFDGLMLNEHHSMPGCMGSVMNVEAAILARITQRAKIVLMGNVLPDLGRPALAGGDAVDDRQHLARTAGGGVGAGNGAGEHRAQQPVAVQLGTVPEAHDFIVKAWTTPGPFRWEGEHFDYRYVNPWPAHIKRRIRPSGSPGQLSKNTLAWAAQHRYPFLMLATELEPTRQSFEYYDECAREAGYEAGSQHRGYMLKVHVEESEELADATARKYLQGPSNPFLGGQPRPDPRVPAEPAGHDLADRVPAHDQDLGATIARGREEHYNRTIARDKLLEKVKQRSSEVRERDRDLHRTAGAVQHHHGHAEDSDPESAPRDGVPATGQPLLLGRRRRHGARGRHAQPAAHGRGGVAGRA